jgi:hypothetical protein
MSENQTLSPFCDNDMSNQPSGVSANTEEGMLKYATRPIEDKLRKSTTNVE